MKKTIVVILIAFVAVASASAFKFNSIGIETGNGYHISADMDIIENLDVYARLGYIGVFTISAGAQYYVADFKIDSTKIDVKPGAQMTFGFGDNLFVFVLHGTCQFSFDANRFSAFVRPGLGLSVSSYSYYDYYEGRRRSTTSTSFSLALETGVRYLF